MKATEAARNIRKDLKQAFPKTKFQVKTSHLDDGACIVISWGDFPPKNRVREVAGRYEVIRNDPAGINPGGNRYVILKQTWSAKVRMEIEREMPVRNKPHDYQAFKWFVKTAEKIYESKYKRLIERRDHNR